MSTTTIWIFLIQQKMAFKKERMAKIRFRGSYLADLDFLSKSDPFLVLSRPEQGSHGLVEVRQIVEGYEISYTTGAEDRDYPE